MSKLQEKPSALQREHPALHNMKLSHFFQFLLVIFALLNPDSDPADHNPYLCGPGFPTLLAGSVGGIFCILMLPGFHFLFLMQWSGSSVSKRTICSGFFYKPCLILQSNTENPQKVLIHLKIWMCLSTLCVKDRDVAK
jgi:hypothetical protein